MIDRIDTVSTGASGGGVMENSFSLARVFGRVVPGRFVVGVPGSVVFGFGVSPLLRLVRTAVLLTLFVTSLLTVFIATSNAADLPDDRGYELVSPAVKNGSDVIAQGYKTFAAAAGGAVAFPAVGAFQESLGTSLDMQYLARRDGVAGTSGWRTRAINPRGSAPTLRAITLNDLPTFEAGFTPDLTGAIYKAWAPVTRAPNVSDASNLYRLRDLDASEPEVQLLTAGTSPLASVDPALELFFGNAFDGASRDLKHVIFQSPWNLTGDGGFSFTGNLYEYADGAGVRLVGRVPSGTDPSCDDASSSPCVDAPGAQAGISVTLVFESSQYSAGMISDDGSRILFQTPSGAIYMREDGTKTYQLNASEKTVPESAGSAGVWGMAADGSRVFFTTDEGLIDGDNNSTSDLYMYDRTAPAGSRLTLVSVNRTGEATGAGEFIGASADGHYVYFVCSGQLVPGEPLNVSRGLYVWHDGEVAYIGSFAAGGGEAVLNSPRASWSAPTHTRGSRVTPDGRFLLFTSKSDEGFRGRGGFAGYDHGSTCVYGGLGPCRELYLYSADTGRLVCVSCNATASVATGDALPDVRAGASASVATQHLSHALSDDGRRVFFSSQESLVPEDTNGKWDAYEYDVSSATVHLISSGTDPADSYFMDASGDAGDVFFVTRERLVGWDVDANYDLYDARVNGGLPDPIPPSTPCAGETCQGPLTGAPSGPSFGSSLLTTSTGNAVPVSKKTSKSASKSLKFRKALRACKSKRSKAKRKKCESSARKRFGKPGGSK